MVCQELQLAGVVRERGRDHVAVELVVVVPPNTKRAAERVEDAAHVASFAAQVENLSPRVQVGFARFDKWDAVVRAVVGEASPEVPVVGGVADANLRQAGTVEGVGNIAVRRAKITGPATAAAEMQRHAAVADGDVTRRSAFLCAGSGVHCHRAGRTPDRHGRDFIGDNVDQPADRVGAEEQRRGAANDFNA
jgi:hypothetical protein